MHTPSAFFYLVAAVASAQILASARSPFDNLVPPLLTRLRCPPPRPAIVRARHFLDVQVDVRNAEYAAQARHIVAELGASSGVEASIQAPMPSVPPHQLGHVHPQKGCTYLSRLVELEGLRLQMNCRPVNALAFPSKNLGVTAADDAVQRGYALLSFEQQLTMPGANVYRRDGSRPLIQ